MCATVSTILQYFRYFRNATSHQLRRDQRMRSHGALVVRVHQSVECEGQGGPPLGALASGVPSGAEGRGSWFTVWCDIAPKSRVTLHTDGVCLKNFVKLRSECNETIDNEKFQASLRPTTYVLTITALAKTGKVTYVH